ncbi:methionine adenosyltransferase [Bacteroidetes bacterium endosymbiont of Geopemphigus sp.]|uniref:methionine adenosyltransferase n=1 Tax=Bacteroidetes bacterium endosymbiont of Geopemphigus sp. TaxID=2047937 RepID=UPI000CD15E9C|nr:methionine adenosyltransferase [Bacteroidetes bacterium endosymbiont of Geopemphigus sp.]
MSHLFTSESVSEGHPDKIADQISDALLDQFLAFDPQARVAIETLVTTGQVVLAGEVCSKTWVDIERITRALIRKIGYTKSEYKFDADACGIFSAIHEQSPDIFQGIVKPKKEEQGAGDQGMMFGYATKETENYMPLALDLSHRLLRNLSVLRREEIQMPYLRPDAKAQVTLEYADDNIPTGIDTIVISTQHDEFDSQERMHTRIREDIQKILIPKVKAELPEHLQRLFTKDIRYYINPTGKFIIGGPHGDAGLTGRKIIVDTYGGKGAHGGGAFSGKDPSKVDRSASYAARHIAKNLVAAGIADELLLQISYAIGHAEPTGIYINTYGTSKIVMTDRVIAEKVMHLFDLRPYAIEKNLKLRTPIYEETAVYGHMGRMPQIVRKSFINNKNQIIEKEVELFTWEKLDKVSTIQKVFKI